MTKRQQYIVQKYVMAESVEEAIQKAKKLPVHECYISNAWFEKVAGCEFYRVEVGSNPGFGKLSTSSIKK